MTQAKPRSTKLSTTGAEETQRSLSKLTEKERLKFLKAALKVDFKTLALATYHPTDSDDDEIPVFGGRGAETLRKLFDPANSTTPWRAAYARPIVLWLKQSLGFSGVAEDLFTADLRTREAFEQSLRGEIAASDATPIEKSHKSSLAIASGTIDITEVATLATILEREALELLRVESSSLSGESSMTVGRCSRDRVLAAAVEASEHLNQYEGSNRDQGVAITRYVSNVCYWFARIKPISDVRMRTGEDEREITDINERIALYLIPRLLLRIVRSNPSMAPPRWQNCRTIQCGNSGLPGQCFFHKYQESLHADEGLLSEWLTHLLGHEPVSANVFRVFLEQSILLCCEDSTPPIS